LYLNKLLSGLPKRQKEALFLRYNQGLGVEEIAEMLDVNYKSAKNLLYRGLFKLRKEWKGKSSDYCIAVFRHFLIYLKKKL
jgi:RNA polymerase sigma factor (sigma-70 family)